MCVVWGHKVCGNLLDSNWKWIHTFPTRCYLVTMKYSFTYELNHFEMLIHFTFKIWINHSIRSIAQTYLGTYSHPSHGFHFPTLESVNLWPTSRKHRLTSPSLFPKTSGEDGSTQLSIISVSVGGHSISTLPRFSSHVVQTSYFLWVAHWVKYSKNSWRRAKQSSLLFKRKVV